MTSSVRNTIQEICNAYYADFDNRNNRNTTLAPSVDDVRAQYYRTWVERDGTNLVTVCVETSPQVMAVPAESDPELCDSIEDWIDAVRQD